MVAVSIDRDRDALEEFLKHHPYTVPAVWRFDARKKNNLAAIRKTPTTYFIDHEGKVTDTRLGCMGQSERNDIIGALLQR